MARWRRGRAALVALLALIWACGPLPDAGASDEPRAQSPGAVGVELPLLDIRVEGGGLPGDEDTPGLLRLTEPDGAGGSRVLETPVLIRLRGNTSRRFPKKSYRLKLVDASGDKVKLSLCGLRADDDWILNPMYSDTSKIREALSLWLWEAVNSCGQAARASGLAYAEVRLNGEYWGLYALQERVDRKQVGADRQRGVLYKVAANDRLTAAELLAAGRATTCRGLELAFAGDGVDAPWAPAADYLAFLDGEAIPGGARLSRENAVDYGIWSLVTQAGDNHFKNMFIHCVPQAGGYVLYRIPWDLDHTLGDRWDGDSPDTNYLAYEVGELALDDALVRLLAEGDEAFADALRERWRALRAGPLREEAILERARALFEGIYPALLRDTERWPACGMGEGSAANIRDIEDAVRVTLARVDGWMEAGLPLPAR